MRKYLVGIVVGLFFATSFAGTANAYGHKVYKNPNMNPSINPNRNPAINPNMNRQINPNFNPQINPNMNRQINPNFSNPKPRK